MNHRYAAILAVLALAVPARAENTVEDWSWKVDHFQRHGIWETVCDHRDDNGALLRRCYVAHVDVFSPRPKFAAAFVFVTPEEGADLQFEFRFEPGTRFDPGGFALVEGDSLLWKFDHATCPSLKCFVRGEAAAELAGLLTAGRALRFQLTDRWGRFWDLQWDAAGFADAVVDLRKQATARQL